MTRVHACLLVVKHNGHLCVYIYMPLFHMSVPVTGLSKLHGWWCRFSSGNKTAGSETLAAFKWLFQLSGCVFLSHCFCECGFLLVEKWTSSKCSGLAWLPLTWLSLQPFSGTWKRPMWPQTNSCELSQWWPDTYHQCRTGRNTVHTGSRFFQFRVQNVH